MARSAYIWLVTCPHGPVAAFTVKHELVTWLERQKTLNGVEVYKLADNPTLYPELFTNPTPAVREVPLAQLIKGG